MTQETLFDIAPVFAVTFDKDPATFAPDYTLVFHALMKRNPGKGYGYYCLTSNRTGRTKRADNFALAEGKAITNNRAAYLALAHALSKLLELIQRGGDGPENFTVEIGGCVQFIIRQLKDEMGVSEHLNDVHEQCLRLMGRFKAVNPIWLPKEQIYENLGLGNENNSRA